MKHSLRFLEMLATQPMGNKRHYSNYNTKQDLRSPHESFHGDPDKSWNMGDNAISERIIEESF